MKIKFQQKFFDISYNQIKDTNHKFIKKDGEHIFEPECIIDLQNTNKDSVKLEQVGVYISGEFQDIKDVIIDEAYYGENGLSVNYVVVEDIVKQYYVEENQKTINVLNT